MRGSLSRLAPTTRGPKSERSTRGTPSTAVLIRTSAVAVARAVGLYERLAHRDLSGGDPQAGPRCAADWRRPDGYWVCTRPAGHGGRHRMRQARADTD